jgi:hypothetical protein
MEGTMERKKGGEVYGRRYKVRAEIVIFSINSLE